MTMTEKEKMLAGQVYDACNPEILQELNRCKDLIFDYNNLRPSQLEERKALLKKTAWCMR